MQTRTLGKYCLVITSVETKAKIKIGNAAPTTENKRLAISHPFDVDLAPVFEPANLMAIRSATVGAVIIAPKSEFNRPA